MQEIIKCKDCKWWDCASCENKKLISKLKTFKGKNIVSFRSSDNIYAPYLSGIFTGANFGCVHGELREENK